MVICYTVCDLNFLTPVRFLMRGFAVNYLHNEVHVGVR